MTNKMHQFDYTMMCCLLDPITTTPPPTTHGVQVHMTNPCIQNQTVCDKFCGEGYLLGPDGCQYCLCRNLIPGLVYTKGEGLLRTGLTGD